MNNEERSEEQKKMESAKGQSIKVVSPGSKLKQLKDRGRKKDMRRSGEYADKL